MNTSANDTHSSVGGAADMAPAIGDAPTDDAPVAGMAEVDETDDSDTPTDEPRGYVAPRKKSTRDFARRIAEAHKGKLTGDAALDVGLKPVIGEAKPATPPAAAPAKTPEPAKPAEPAPAAGPDERVVAQWEALNAERARLESERTDLTRQRERVARFARGKLTGNAGEMREAMTALLRDDIGDDASDAEINEALGDLVSELSLSLSGVTLPDSARLAAETRRATRLVTGHNRREARRAKEEAANRARADEERQFTTTADLIGKELETANSHPFLRAANEAERDGKTPGRFVLEVIRQRKEHDGTTLSWKEAANLADKYFEQRAREHHARWAQLLTPPAAPPAAATQGAHQGGRSESQVPRTLSNIAASEPAAPAEEPSPSEWSTDDHRARMRAKWNGKLGRKTD